jgi:hypothetical protein
MSSRQQDRKIFAELVRFLIKKKTSAGWPDRLVLEIGKFFLGTPYAAGTLDTKGPEQVVVNLREFDCVTFVETVFALAWAARSGKRSFEFFRIFLGKIRYRSGRLRGYPSRLHYFSDWIHDNQKKGMVRNVTAEIGEERLRKVVNFMTTHPDLYPRLKDVANLQRTKSVERAISRRSLFFVPKKALRHWEDRLRDGDIIAITTRTRGLDVEHVGIAARVKNRIHLLHASSKEGKVVISKETVYRYLMQASSRSGIMVARITPSPY